MGTAGLRHYTAARLERWDSFEVCLLLFSPIVWGKGVWFFVLGYGFGRGVCVCVCVRSHTQFSIARTSRVVFPFCLIGVVQSQPRTRSPSPSSEPNPGALESERYNMVLVGCRVRSLPS